MKLPENFGSISKHFLTLHDASDCCAGDHGSFIREGGKIVELLQIAAFSFSVQEDLGASIAAWHAKHSRLGPSASSRT